VSLESLYNLIRKSTGYSLRNLCVSWIPVFWFGFDCYLNFIFVIPAELLKITNINFTDQLKATFRRLLQEFSEKIPMID